MNDANAASVAPAAVVTSPGPQVRSLHRTREERAAAGKAARTALPREALGDLLVEGRADPIELLEGQAATRVPDLVPIRYERMVASPFAFYRGGALLMAADLSRTPNSGLHVQLCGDAHLSNFGVFATPERRVVFDINDFDETHPGPFEWDVKRLVASLAVAGRANGFAAKKRRGVALDAAAGYRQAMRQFAEQGNLDVWYTHLDTADLVREIGKKLDKKREARTQEVLRKARTRNSAQALGKLTTAVDGRSRILSQPPLLVPFRELWGEDIAQEAFQTLTGLVDSYRRTLQPDRRHLLAQFELVDAARKVVGVGSVGTRAWILLFDGVDGRDPLFLQAKEAQASVLAGYVKGRGYPNQGRRVVAGQHLMQAASDIFLGWQRAVGPDGIERDYYLRQLRDGKGSVDVSAMAPDAMALYGRICGQTLARAHARSGDRVTIAAYLGSGRRFDDAMADFAEAYADLNQQDHRALADAMTRGG